MPKHFYRSPSRILALAKYATKRITFRSSVDIFAQGRTRKTYHVCWA